MNIWKISEFFFGKKELILNFFLLGDHPLLTMVTVWLYGSIIAAKCSLLK